MDITNICFTKKRIQRLLVMMFFLSFLYLSFRNYDLLPPIKSVLEVDRIECVPINETERLQIMKEIDSYQTSPKFKAKIREAEGLQASGKTHTGISEYLLKNILEPGWSILELGCAAGNMLRIVRDIYKVHLNSSQKELVGVELVQGWAEWANNYFEDIQVYEGDVTHFNLDGHEQFDFVMLNDVIEHIQSSRYGCLFRKLQEVTHIGSVVYMHIPTPQAQLIERDQFIENVVPHHFLISGMSRFGFELVTLEHDVQTDCGSNLIEYSSNNIPRQVRKSRCSMNGWAKYCHMVFRRSSDRRLFQIRPKSQDSGI